MPDQAGLDINDYNHVITYHVATGLVEGSAEPVTSQAEEIATEEPVPN